jgi:eukaryotic-like serine/threonine-protein kinase
MLQQRMAPILLEIGSTIGDYEVVGLLGRGGMGKVYKVRNVISDRVEAMKVLLPDTEATPELAERFVREIKVVASLDHPYIASLRTALRVDSQLLMIMECVEGSSVDQKLRGTKMDVGQAVHYTTQVLDALGYAHRRGVVHRDVKPSNILISADNNVKLTDFGIASRSGDPRLTATGMAVGSLYYMSPEQVRAMPLDARSDLYSVGVTLYEMVTGKRPIEGDSFYAILRAHLEQKPLPAIQLAPHLPTELSHVLEKALEKAPDDRFQTADEFRSALLRTGTFSKAVARDNEVNVTPRPAFSAVHGQALTASLISHAPPPVPASTPGMKSWDPALLDTATKRLAVYIGPMARVIVGRAAKSARNMDDLYQTLAAEIPSPADRQKFLRSLPL